MSPEAMGRATRCLMAGAGAALIAIFCVWLGLCVIWEDHIISGLAFMALSVPFAFVTRSMISRALPPEDAHSGAAGGG